MIQLDFCQQALYLVVSSDKTKILLPPVTSKKQAVQIANFLRQWKLKCEVKNVLSFCFWVEVQINCQT